MLSEEPIAIEADGAVLEGRLHLPDAATVAAVFCHPHPQYGGDMDNPVVITVVGALAARGWATLRFNFRGVGGSSGSFGGGAGERDDAAAALGRLAERCPAARLVLGGYSFGAAIALDLGMAREDVAAILAVAPPLAMMPFDANGDATVPVLMVAGDRDAFCPPEAFAAAARSLGPAAHGALIGGADHFFSGCDASLTERLGELIDRAFPN